MKHVNYYKKNHFEKIGEIKLKKIVISVGLAVSLFSSMAFADGKSIAGSLKLDASSKAIKQWQRLFADNGKMAELKIDKLSGVDKDALKKYLIDHAADSDHPAAAGL